MRRPDADLHRLPIGLDLRAINVAEGLRAAFAVSAIILLNEWLNQPALTYAALAAYLTCFCDIGGPVGRRIPTLLAFALLGAAAWAGFGLCRMAGPEVALPLAALAIFCNSFARVWGPSTTAAGNVLTIVVVLALDVPLDPHGAAIAGGLFVLGSAWAVLLTAAVWRMNPYQPVQRAVAEAWHALAALAGDMRELTGRDGVQPAEWEAHARAFRRAVRDAIEQARATVTDTIRSRGTASSHAEQTLIRLEAADQIFGMLIALSDLIEYSADPVRRTAAARLLRVLRPLLLVMSQSILNNRIARPARMERALAKGLVAVDPDPGLRPLANAVADRLRIAIKLMTPDGIPPAPTPADPPRQPLRERVLAPVRANLTWNSAILRHATRAAVVGAVALAITMIWPGPFQHWLTIMAVLTMQPFFAATWQRALERTAGTLLGASVGAVLAMFAHSPVVLAALMFPLCAAGFSMRQVSYGAYIACLSPGLVVFIEVAAPGHSAWMIAGSRAFFAVGGGLMAIAASLVLWPTWEPDRLQRELRAAIAAHADYADAMFAVILGETGEAAIEQARRAAGVASNNLEASLSRALNEPRHRHLTMLEVAMLTDATLRRFAGALQALRYEQIGQSPTDRVALGDWRRWIAEALAALATHQRMPPRPSAPPNDPIFRMARQIELMDGAVRRLG